jgi:uncharacterized protein with HEPN domain
MIAFVEGLRPEQYLADEKTRFAVARCYEILGEAVRHVPDWVKNAHPDVPWRMMAAVRNRIVHGYFGIDDSILFETIGSEIAALLPRLVSMRDEIAGV